MKARQRLEDLLRQRHLAWKRARYAAQRFDAVGSLSVKKKWTAERREAEERARRLTADITAFLEPLIVPEKLDHVAVVDLKQAHQQLTAWRRRCEDPLRMQVFDAELRDIEKRALR